LVGKINEVETKNEDKNIREMYWDVYKNKSVKNISCVKEKCFFKPVSSTNSSARAKNRDRIYMNAALHL